MEGSARGTPRKNLNQTAKICDEFSAIILHFHFFIFLYKKVENFSTLVRIYFCKLKMSELEAHTFGILKCAQVCAQYISTAQKIGALF